MNAKLPTKQARSQVQRLFRKNAHVQDPVIVDMLVKKVRGWMDTGQFWGYVCT